MGFLIQYTCPKCGYKTPDYGDGEFRDPWSEEEGIRTCHSCHRLFQWNDKAEVEKGCCPHCGSKDIELNEDTLHIKCPVCGHDLEFKDIGSYF